MTSKTFLSRTLWIAVATALSTVTALRSHADTPPMQVELSDGSDLVGNLSPAASPATLQLNCEPFVEPLQIPSEQLLEAKTLAAADSVKAATTGFGFELRNGNRFVGQLEQWADGLLTVRTESVGNVTFPDDELIRILSASRVRPRLASLETSHRRWRLDGWAFGGPGLKNLRPRGVATGDLDLPDRFSLRLRLACDGAPDFALVLGGSSPDEVGSGFRGRRRSRLPSERLVTKLEWFDRSVSIVRANASVSEAAVFRCPEAGVLDLELFVDQVAGRVACYQQGERVGEAALRDEEPAIRRQLSMTSKSDAVTLQRLDLFRWDGKLPESAKQSERFTLLRDGKMLPQGGEGWKQGRWQVGDQSFETARLAWMEFGGQTSPRPLDQCLVLLRDGTRLIGRFDASETRTTYRFRSLDETIYEFAVDEVERLVGRATDVLSAAKPTATLTTSKSRIRGQLASGQSLGTDFAWRPRFNDQAMAIASAARATVTFAEAVADDETQEDRTTRIALVSGDQFAGEVLTIDDRGVQLRSKFCGKITVPHEAIWSAELQVASTPTMEQNDLRELLTIPRKQADRPPRHVLLGIDGDLLRGNLVSVDASRIQIEIRSRVISLDRSRVATVIWLDQNSVSRPMIRYEVATRGGDRLSFETLSLGDGKLVGKHPVLGLSSVEMKRASALHFGNKREPADSQRKLWQTVPAKTPRTFEDR
jgi:hypothetical protein